MYQSLVEGREVPWSLLVKDVPKKYHRDLDYLVEQLDWESNVDPKFKDNHYLEPVPVADTSKEGYMDRWIVYGKVDDAQLFSAKELTVEPGTTCTIKDNGAYGLICVVVPGAGDYAARLPPREPPGARDGCPAGVSPARRGFSRRRRELVVPAGGAARL